MNKKALVIEIIIVCIVVLALLILLGLKIYNSKNEAEMSKSIRNLATLINDVDTYYSNNENFIDIPLMTKVGLDKDMWFFVKSEKCLHFSTFRDFLIVKKIEKPGELCSTLLSYDSVKSLLIGKDTPGDEAVSVNISNSNTIFIRMGIKYDNSIL
ncbi:MULTISPECIES: hypothetical protein [unclassified Campylobacter]|uniref:hypothetical protein n=1 Tax=unclassified Campylobacter TaxID=2593542 RepID=UPI001DE32A0C|nr:hypothetical protein [Campylobacter sp. RM9331]MBZ8004849.1 hypothetical protein [Campylobacter sp. RM9332]